MKALLVSNFKIEEGRGPMFRIINMLPYLKKYCDVQLCSFGSYDKEIIDFIDNLDIKKHEVPYKNKGWFVINKKEIAKSITKIVNDEKIDLIVLTWEIWDIAVELENEKKFHNADLAIVMHSIPFVGSMIDSNKYYIDYIKKMIFEKRWMIKKYLLLRMFEVNKYIYKFNIITMTKTVEKKLCNYFKKINLYLSYPGYAIENLYIKKNSNYIYDFIYMAKFEYGKGIFEIIDIMKKIKKKKTDFKLALVGSFTFQDEENRFLKKLKKYELLDNVHILGWKDGKEKYDLINQSKLFLYPSFSGDTFSQCLLEALSCGKMVICYDVPFTRDNFNISTVKRIPVFNNDKFADTVLKELEFNDYFLFYESIKFVKKNYNSWDMVAKAEYNCYKKILEGHVYDKE